MSGIEIALSVIGGVVVPILVAVLVAIFASLRSIHRDIGDLRERMARLEGLFEGFTGRKDAQAT